MKRSIRIFLAIALALALAFIWGNSLLPSELSRQESRWVQELLAPVLIFLRSGRLQAALASLSARAPQALRPAIDRLLWLLENKVLSISDYYLVRKAAHFFLFAVLGLIVGLLTRGRLWLAAPGCLGAAIIDEALQLNVDGRAAQWRDVGVDMCGAVFGMLLALVVLVIFWPKDRSVRDDGKNP